MKEGFPIETNIFETKIKPELDKKGFAELPELSKNDEQKVLSLLDGDQVDKITGKVRASFNSKMEDWPSETYLFNTERIEKVELGYHDEDYYILRQPEGYPILHTEKGTVLLVPLDVEELQSA